MFTVTALPEKQQRVLLCLDLKTGEILWQKVVIEAPLEEKHAENSYASSTPATDGENVYAAFLDGQNMLVATYDFFGKPLWLVRPVSFSSPHGFCSSLVLYKDKIIFNAGGRADSFCVLALSRDDGRTIWTIPQEKRTFSYSTPFIQENGRSNPDD